MQISWPLIKEAFFAIGSVAGFVAFFRPVMESKFQRDADRAERIKQLLDEQRIVDLSSLLYQHRSVPETYFEPFDRLRHEVQSNQDGTRFSGPLRKYLKRELDAILSSYKELREYVQVPEWEPVARSYEGQDEYYWDFNKQAFFDRDIGAPRDYAKHLAAVSDCASKIRSAFQRFQIVSELHLMETPIAWLVLPKRFKAYRVA